jgi:transposase
MNNVSFHDSEKILQISADAVVGLGDLPPYLPVLNPIEEVFT